LRISWAAQRSASSPSVFLSACLSNCEPFSKNDCLSVSQSVSLSVCPTVCLSSCLTICLPFCPSVCVPACLPACLPAFLSVCLPVFLSVFLEVCLYVCLSVSTLDNVHASLSQFLGRPLFFALFYCIISYWSAPEKVRCFLHSSAIFRNEHC